MRSRSCCCRPPASASPTAPWARPRTSSRRPPSSGRQSKGAARGRPSAPRLICSPKWQPPRSGHPSSPRITAPAEASSTWTSRSRPAQPARVLHAPARDPRPRGDGLSLLAHPVGGRAHLRPRRDHPRRTAGAHRRARRGGGAQPRGDLPELLQRVKDQAEAAPLVIPVLFGLRLGRWGMIGFAAAAFLSILAQTAGFYQIAGHSPSARAAFGASMSALAAQFVALFPTPIRPDTVGGFVEFRGIHPLGILLCVWALVSATGFARGDEERGIVEASLATPTSRAALVASRAAAFTIAIAVASLAACAGYLAGLAIGHETAARRGVLEAGVLLV